MIQYRCHHCGEIHEGFPDLGFSAPDYFHGLADDQKSDLAELSDDTCRIDNDFFIRGSLEIPIVGEEDFYSYGVWLSVSESNFSRYQQHLQDNSRNLGDRYVGYLSNAIPGYRNTLELIAAACVRENWRPLIELEPTDHPLARLQRNGMTVRQLSELVAEFIH